MLDAVAAHPAAAAKHASIVIDANSGRTLHQSAADAPRYPASLTKMMTIYMAFEAMRGGKLKFSTPITMSASAASRPPSKLGLKPGSTISVRDALNALITKSANDVAAAVGEHLAGSESAFAQAMTRTARRLGMSRTHFRNASGLPNSSQVTTARDMAKLSLALQDDFPKLFKMFARRHFTYRGRSYRNHNRLLGSFRGTEGIKTGYTRASGFNVAVSVKRDGKHLIGVVMGRRSARQRDAVARKLLRTALPKASRRKTRQQKPMLIARPRLIKRPMPARRPAPLRPRRPLPALPAAERYAIPGDPRPYPFEPPPRVAALNAPVRPGQPQPLGRPPSTFAHQVARMNLAPPGSLAGPQTAADRSPLITGSLERPLVGPHTHQVQVGAYRSKADAERALADARNSAGAVLRGARALAVRIGNPRRPIYRARFAGFDATRAAQVCNRLRQLAIDCFVARSQ